MPSTYAYRMNARMNNLRFRKINDITENYFTYELATNKQKIYKRVPLPKLQASPSSNLLDHLGDQILQLFFF